MEACDLYKAQAIFERMLKTELREPVRIGRGKNSRVFRLEPRGGGSAGDFPPGTRFCGKLYHRSESDTRDRLGTEFGALSFLDRHGHASVPRPVGIDRQNNAAIYSFLEGHPPEAAEVGTEQGRWLARFLLDLQRLKTEDEAHKLNRASEACFSPRELEANLTTRVKRIRELARPSDSKDGPDYDALHDFLTQELQHALSNELDAAQNLYLRAGLDWKASIALEERVLSPSDVGFHNTLRNSDGELAVLDFEYFGWDDPVKTVSDLVLHPAVPVSEKVREAMASTFLSGLKGEVSVRRRLEALFPLYQIKWCIILLNEFVPADESRRRFAHADSALDSQVLRRFQLENSRKLLRGIDHGTRRFPY